jgi:fructosamine-3-kinase
MKLSDCIKEEVARVLREATGAAHQVLNAAPLGGGSINEAGKVQTDRGVFFIKINRSKAFPGMFGAEARGLALLRETGEVYVPSVLGIGEAGEDAFLLAEFISPGQRSTHFFYEFGQALARLHTHTQASFGLGHSNYIGSLQQFNDARERWPEFFAEMRLEVQLKLARDSGKIGAAVLKAFEKLNARLEEIFPPGPPALLHGDLWSGNYMTSPSGGACIFDPAVYFGHREMDIAMSKLFGGFPRDFYEGYNAQWPLEKGWEQRVDICNLYPLLVHVNLFGGGYLSDVTAIVRRFA